MTLEIRLRRFSFLPGLIQTGNGEPRKAHFLGKKQATPVEKQDQGQGNDSNPQRQNSGRYRPLGSITLGEVDDAMRHFLPQMVTSPVEGWIARNYFCQLPVRQRTEDQSPVVFGRVKTCFPGDGNIQNIDQMELYFPNSAAGPDLLNIRRSDILAQHLTQSYCVGVKMYLSETELEDFRRSENFFLERGFAPLYETGYLDLLDFNEQDQSSLLWLNVIGSEWFSLHPRYRPARDPHTPAGTGGSEPAFIELSPQALCLPISLTQRRAGFQLRVYQALPGDAPGHEPGPAKGGGNLWRDLYATHAVASSNKREQITG